MKIAIGSDNAGFHLKEEIKAHLTSQGHEVKDWGTLSTDKEVKFMYASDRVAKAVQSGDAERGLVFCGTGAGVSIVANKHKGIYCVPVESQWAARSARFINNANMLAMGERIVAPVMAKDIVDTFLNTDFHEGADEKRAAVLKGLVDEVEKLEETLLP